MSLDKAIQYGKEHRKPYRGAKAIDCTCRNHGSCGWCEGNRLYNTKKKELAADISKTCHGYTCQAKKLEI